MAATTTITDAGQHPSSAAVGPMTHRKNDSMSNADVSETAILEEIPNIIAWLSGLGLPSTNSRYARYERIIDEFYKAHPHARVDGGQQAFRHLSLAYRECIDIYAVYTSFKHLRDAGLIERLSKAVTGPDVPEVDEVGQSRDFAFELLMAARFHQAGYTIDFGQKTDVVARRDGITVRVECKRITSEKKLRERVNKAASQLAEAPAIDGEKVIGLIYVDVSACIVEKVKVEVATRQQAADELNKALRAFLMENIMEVEALNTKHLDLSHGTCLIATLPIWTHDFTMHAVSGTEVRAAGALSDERFDELRRALEGFDRSFKGVFNP
jgi:hypothetical protein